MQKYLFERNDVIAHINYKLKHKTPIRIQKLLYFAWAFYNSNYGNIDYQNDSEFKLQEKYPPYLFSAQFKAIQTGPVIEEVLQQMKNGSINDLNQILLAKNQNQQEGIFLINDLIKQVDCVNEFGLINRAKQDSAWQDAYKSNSMMNLKQIEDDYINYLQKAKSIN